MNDPQHSQTIVINQARQSQALPALVNVFMPGIGQLIQGRVVAWLAWWFVFFVINVTVAVLTAGIGLLVSVPLLWILCIIDAALYHPPTQTQQM